jgi:murein hydrolase activator
MNRWTDEPMNRFFVAAGLLLCAIAAGQSEQNSDLAKIRSRISALQGKLAESEKSVATLSEEVKRLDLKLEIAQKEAELVAATREEFARQLAVTRAERAASAESSQRLARALVARARVLHRFGRFGYFRVLLESNDVHDFLGGLERLDALARRDGSLLSRYRQMEARKEADIARENALKSELDRLYSQGSAEVARMATLRRERETLLAREKSARTSRRDEVMALSDKASRLERLLQRLAQTSTAQAAPDPSGGIRPWRGVLDWPARGTLIETFGRHRHPKFDAWTFSSGIALGLPAGTPVRAVYSGRAIYAQWLAEYGNLVILDHGDGVFTLYAWLQSVGVSAGAYVPAGGSVGAAGWGPGREEPGLYFEVRDHQKANDPVAWLR